MAVPKAKNTNDLYFEEKEELNSSLEEGLSLVPNHDHGGSVARLLMDTRQSKNYSIKHVADKLRISVRYLEAIETANTNELPERVYALGFIRSYARFLNLNGDEILERYKEEILLETPDVSYFKFDQQIPATHPTKKILWFSIPAALVLAAGLWWMLHKDESVPESAPIPPQLIEEAKDESAPSQSDQKSLSEPPVESHEGAAAHEESTPSEAPDSHGSELSAPSGVQVPDLRSTPPAVAEKSNPIASFGPILLSFSERSWVEIKDANGVTLISRIFNAGDSFEIPRKEGLILTTGNAGGIRASVSGRPEKVLGKKGIVIKQLSLDEKPFLSYLDTH